jgi:hypothetical protein
MQESPCPENHESIFMPVLIVSLPFITGGRAAIIYPQQEFKKRHDLRILSQDK